ncbi:hypothetical protein IB69_019170 [Xanthomonas citri]|nr:hypothetical protein RM64_08720 [Xanthomonas phaseoli pv. phaseoli]KHS33484.1 hypothetical protein RN19_21475 [Xanthomonas phaseoli pv. phaseoli]OQP83032.1 hypothetical protein IB69_019170 [Xanthomonas citri]
MLLFLEKSETFGQLQPVQHMGPRSSTYFFITFFTYCTALIRIPKSTIWRRFQPCFGFRRMRIEIPKKGWLTFFGFVERACLWITVRVEARLGQTSRHHLQA